MSGLPEMAPCASCGERWPEPVLDNLGRCAQCGLDDAPVRCDTCGQPAVWSLALPGRWLHYCDGHFDGERPDE